MSEQILTSEDGRYFVNHSDKVFFREEISWEWLGEALQKSENAYRKWLFQCLLAPKCDIPQHVLYSGKRGLVRSNGATYPTILSRTEKSSKSATKFHYIKRPAVFLDWLWENGKISKKCRKKPQRFSRLCRFEDLVLDMSIGDLEKMLKDTIVEPETRVSLSSAFFETSLEANFEALSDALRSQKYRQTPDQWFQSIFEYCVTASFDKPNRVKAKRERLVKMAARHFCFYVASLGKAYLPATTLLGAKSQLAFTYTSIMRPFALTHFAKDRAQELIAAATYLKNGFNGQRQISTAECLTLFCATNYTTSQEFAPEVLNLVQIACTKTEIANNMRPYFYGILDHHSVDQNTKRHWDTILTGRNSRAIDDPLFLFRGEPSHVRAVMPVQVRNFEKNSGTTYPKEIDVAILYWADLLEDLGRQLPRGDLGSYFQSVTTWLTYLCTLPAPDRPKSIGDVERYQHITNANDATLQTFKSFLNDIGVEPRARLRDLHQAFELWINDQPTPFPNPIDPSKDWKNSSKGWRTSRRSIPSLIIETLIEENARECRAGEPYRLYRQWKAESKRTTIDRIDGKSPEEVIPAVPAVLDCILNFGMRSSSARWIDSGQGDQYVVDPDTLEQTPNPSDHAQSGVRNGVIQRQQIGPEHFVLSLLLTKNKTLNVHEIPYFPRKLAERLLFIKERQNRYNPISSPIYAVENTTTSNNLESEPVVWPLFRDPASSEIRPISANKLHEWWRRLLRHCEPIVHAKRQKLLGDEIARYKFFSRHGIPIWDIHSIRVAVVTALLEMGVPPTVVQNLVGHKSPIMTLHYQSIEAGKVHATLANALEARRMSAVEAIAEATNEEELRQALETTLGGLAIGSSGAGVFDAAARVFKTSKSLQQNPGALAVFSHGVCPGGLCDQGGKKFGNTHLPVHRQKACSRCRFRITGPAFLGGLEQNANILMSEIGASLKKEEELNKEILELSRANRPSAAIEYRVTQERNFRDEIYSDWAAEVTTILKCLELLSSQTQDKELPAIPNDVTMTIAEDERLHLLQKIMNGKKSIAGASFDIPNGLEAERNEILLDIAKHDAEFTKYLISLPREQRNEAFNEFGEMVCSLATEADKEPEEAFIAHLKSVQAGSKLYKRPDVVRDKEVGDKSASK